MRSKDLMFSYSTGSVERRVAGGGRGGWEETAG